jgi:hypothetical protein
MVWRAQGDEERDAVAFAILKRMCASLDECFKK